MQLRMKRNQAVRTPWSLPHAESHQQANTGFLSNERFFHETTKPIPFTNPDYMNMTCPSKYTEKTENLSIHYNIRKIQEFCSLKEIQSLGTCDPAVAKASSE